MRNHFAQAFILSIDASYAKYFNMFSITNTLHVRIVIMCRHCINALLSNWLSPPSESAPDQPLTACYGAESQDDLQSCLSTFATEEEKQGAQDSGYGCTGD